MIKIKSTGLILALFGGTLTGIALGIWPEGATLPLSAFGEAETPQGKESPFGEKVDPRGSEAPPVPEGMAWAQAWYDRGYHVMMQMDEGGIPEALRVPSRPEGSSAEGQMPRMIFRDSSHRVLMVLPARPPFRPSDALRNEELLALLQKLSWEELQEVLQRPVPLLQLSVESQKAIWDYAQKHWIHKGQPEQLLRFKDTEAISLCLSGGMFMKFFPCPEVLHRFAQWPLYSADPDAEIRLKREARLAQISLPKALQSLPAEFFSASGERTLGDLFAELAPYLEQEIQVAPRVESIRVRWLFHKLDGALFLRSLCFTCGLEIRSLETPEQRSLLFVTEDRRLVSLLDREGYQQVRDLWMKVSLPGLGDYIHSLGFSPRPFPYAALPPVIQRDVFTSLRKLRVPVQESALQPLQIAFIPVLSLSLEVQEEANGISSYGDFLFPFR